jgi:hypothetical protein
MVKSQDNRFSTIFPDASFCWFVDEFEVEISEMERVINWLARSRKKKESRNNTGIQKILYAFAWPSKLRIVGQIFYSSLRMCK